MNNCVFRGLERVASDVLVRFYVSFYALVANTVVAIIPWAFEALSLLMFLFVGWSFCCLCIT